MPRASQCSRLMTPARRQLHALSSTRPARRRPTPNTTSSNFFSPSSFRQRTFTQKPSLLLISRPSVRPQLPFLYPFAHSQPATAVSNLNRFVSTATRVRWWRDIKGAARNVAYILSAAALLTILGAGVRQTKVENDHPTPREWSFWSRWYMRSALYHEESEDVKIAGVITDWFTVGTFYKTLLERLEDEAMDGSNLLKGETLVEGIGRTGFDVGMKSEPWRRGYHQALMGAGRAAERLEGMAKRKGDDSGKVYPWDSIPGPSNPRPKLLPADDKGRRKEVPREEECEDAFPQPEVFYMKILTMKGFDTGQRLDAALAYAEWCDFKGLLDTAGNMYDWAMDIAASGLPAEAGNVVDAKTGGISSGKEDFVTQNLFRATTAMAVHHAKTGNVKHALPIFLSVLRARKNLPPQPVGHRPAATRSSAPDSDFNAYLESVKNVLLDTPYPSAPPSGDARPYHTLKEACEEVGLMTYIGEILFATSESQKEKGLSWTRDSVEAAEAVMWVMDEQQNQDGRQTCRECLEIGLKNWKDMTAQMSKLASRKKQDAERSGGFLGTGLGRGSAIANASKEVDRWTEEESQIELRKQKTAPLLRPPQQRASGWSAF